MVSPDQRSTDEGIQATSYSIQTSALDAAVPPSEKVESLRSGMPLIRPHCHWPEIRGAQTGTSGPNGWPPPRERSRDSVQTKEHLVASAAWKRMVRVQEDMVRRSLAVVVFFTSFGRCMGEPEPDVVGALRAHARCYNSNLQKWPVVAR